MTRVEENSEAARVDAQRAEDARKAAEKKEASRREANDQFKKLVAQKQQVSSEAQKKNGARSAEKGAAANALMARQGIQARNFNTALQNRGGQANDKSRADVKQRREDVNKREVDVADKKTKVDNDRLDKTQDQLTPVSRDDRREQGFSGGGASSGGSDSGADTSGHGQPQALVNAIAAHQAEAPQGAQAPRISPEVIQQLVNRVFAGVTPEGLSQFTIEFKDDVLNGARLDVVAENGKIRCTFHTKDKNVGNLLKASEGQLARAFAQKGLTLERLAVEGG